MSLIADRTFPAGRFFAAERVSVTVKSADCTRIWKRREPASRYFQFDSHATILAQIDRNPVPFAQGALLQSTLRLSERWAFSCRESGSPENFCKRKVQDDGRSLNCRNQTKSDFGFRDSGVVIASSGF